MMKVGKFVPAFAVALLLLIAAACAPKITRFDVLPSRVCEGTSSLVTWDISGTPELATNPPIQPLTGEPLRYQAIEDTTFTLTAKRWPHRPAVSETEVRVHQMAAPVRELIAFQMTCEGTSLVGLLPRPATEWDRKIRLETISSDGKREMTVEHEGRSATLSPAEPSTRTFQGAAMAGMWKLTTPLGMNERCGDPAAPPPARLILITHFVCDR